MEPQRILTWREYLLITTAGMVMFACWCWTTEETSGLLLNTGRLAGWVMAISMPLAAMLAYGTTRCHVPLLRFWQGSLLVLLFMPLFIQLAAWEAGFGRGGWYSTLIAKHLSNPPLEGFRGAVCVHVAAAIPWLYWIFRLGFLAVPRAYEEAASLEASPRQVFSRITLPLTLPTALAGALYVLIITSTEITVTDRYQFRTYAEVLYNEYVLNPSLGALPLNIAPILGSLVCVTVAGLIACKLIWPKLLHPTVSKTSPSGATNWLAFAYVGSVVSTLLFLPLGNLLYQAGIEVTLSSNSPAADSLVVDSLAGADGLAVADSLPVARFHRSWSPAKLIEIIKTSPRRYQKELAWTAILAQLSVFSAVLSATCLSCWARTRAWKQLIMTIVAIACFVVPGPFMGLSLIWAFYGSSSSWIAWMYDETLFAPWLAITIRCFPFAYLIVWYGMNSIPQTLLDAAEVDGASVWSRSYKIMLPLLGKSLVCATIVCLAVAIGELSATVLVAPPGVTTVATEIFSLIHYGADDQLAGLCLSCLGVIAALTFFAHIAMHRLKAGVE